MAPDGKSVTFTLRDGVKWSDGKPFTADDVAFTFDLQKELLGGLEFLDSVEAVDDRTVDFTFNTPFTPGLYEVGQQIIIPKHIWESIDDPANETNPTPVGTGPYTEVRELPKPGFRTAQEPQLLAAGQAAHRGHPGAGLRGQRPSQSRHHQR